MTIDALQPVLQQRRPWRWGRCECWLSKMTRCLGMLGMKETVKNAAAVVGALLQIIGALELKDYFL